MTEERKHRAMTFDDWVNEFKPIKNGKSFDRKDFSGVMFETSGNDIAEVKRIMNGDVEGMSSLNVWTLVNNMDTPEEGTLKGDFLVERGYAYDENSCSWVHPEYGELDCDLVVQGASITNRVGYFITQVPADPLTDYDIYFSDLALELSKLDDEPKERPSLKP